MGSMPENSVDAIVTDPPYGFSFMGKKWDYEIPTVGCWTEVLRVLKPGGHLLSFGGPRTYHRLAVAVEDAGFEVRDQLQWIFGSGFPKSLNIGNGWGTALKPANEPILLARKPLSEKTVAKNVERWGTGGINIEGCRIGTTAGNFSQPQGRFPANLLFDEVAADMLDEQTGVLKTGGQKLSSKRGFQTKMVGGKCLTTHESYSATAFVGSAGGASRFFYVAKTSKSERNAGLEGMPTKPMNTYNFSEDGSFTENTTASSGQQQRLPRQNHHPTVKPIKLMVYLCRLITPPNGTILDPFMGSGSTGVAALKEGFKFIGIEKESEYFEIAKRRIEHTAS